MGEEVIKTVELVSLRLTAKKAEALSYVYKTYGEILKEAVNILHQKGITSWVKGIKELYKYFREKYPDLPAKYVDEAIRDAATRLKSFQKLKEKGLAYTEKPEVKQWTVSCHQKLWKLSFLGIEISTHKGWIRIPLLFHKQFYIHYNGGWTLRSTARWKIEDRKLTLYVFFRKIVEPNTNYSRVIGVDVNENNVTLFTLPDHKAITIVTNHSKVVLGYAYRRKAIQERHAHDKRSLRVALRKLREKNVKKALRDKVASIIAKIVKKENAALVLENLPKRFQDKALKKNGLKSFDSHRLMQSAIRGIQKRIVEKALEHGVKVEFVNPKNTSRTCPKCGASLTLMTGKAQRKGWQPRILKCKKCGFSHDRDVIAAWNIAKKLDVSLVPWGSKGAHDPHVEWQVATMNRKVEAQHPSLGG
ncbi:IS605 ORFB family protein [Sulfolobus virus STSV2]|uniref:transposase n=1 Tax=Sulfolobus virus STSV2 TaxID=1123964 RepID=UPI0002A85CF9|nr:transposase [Sulfolobus virus STSV2]AFU92045.1 IS605 ORFB family protein [Sulfolobus virus STSV2]